MFFRTNKGFIQLSIIIGLIITAIALPLVANLVQKNTENRSKAAGVTPTQTCTGNCFSTPLKATGKIPTACSGYNVDYENIATFKPASGTCSTDKICCKRTEVPSVAKTECKVGEKRCINDLDGQICSAAGLWKSNISCSLPQVCQNGACINTGGTGIQTETCTGNCFSTPLKATGKIPTTCSGYDTDYKNIATFKAASGTCSTGKICCKRTEVPSVAKTECKVGEKRCINDLDGQICSAAGLWKSNISCSLPQVCQNGACINTGGTGIQTETCTGNCYDTKVGSPAKLPTACTGYNAFYNDATYAAASGTCSTGKICCKRTEIKKDAVCGSYNGANYSSSMKTSTDKVAFCKTGSLYTPADNGSKVQWTCTGVNGGKDVSCSTTAKITTETCKGNCFSTPLKATGKIPTACSGYNVDYENIATFKPASGTCSTDKICCKRTEVPSVAKTECKVGEKRCINDLDGQICSAAGLWKSNISCSLPQVCQNGACIDTGECKVGEKRCINDLDGQICSAAGLWESNISCSLPQVCQGGACIDTCSGTTSDTCKSNSDWDCNSEVIDINDFLAWKEKFNNGCAVINDFLAWKEKYNATSDN